MTGGTCAHLFTFSLAGLRLARELQEKLRVHPWADRHGRPVSRIQIHIPERLKEYAPESLSFKKINHAAGEAFASAPALIFIGATGIAVRAIAPFLRSKLTDPPVVALDDKGLFAICLLSGHAGGANELTRHIGRLLNACPVISTASDIFDQVALDSLCASHNLKILDRAMVAPFQNMLLEGRKLKAYDPLNILQVPADLERSASLDPDSHCICIDYKKHNQGDALLRLCPVCLYVGLGFCKDFEDLESSFFEIMTTLGLEAAAVAALATVEEKASASELSNLARRLDVPILAWPARELSAIPTPNPSKLCGRRFDLPPFSVAEAAAIMAAGGPSRGRLLYPKIRHNKMTFACAISGSFQP